jgi:hypothetical protein
VSLLQGKAPALRFTYQSRIECEQNELNVPNETSEGILVEAEKILARSLDQLAKELFPV